MTRPDRTGKRWRLHTAFEISLVIKGLMSLTEVISGVGLIYIGTARVARFADWLVQTDLTPDPTDFIGATLHHVATSLSLDTHDFFGMYMIAQGMVKLMTVLALGRGHRWFFPVGAAILSSFVAYQLYNIWLDMSGLLLVLTLFDIVVISLVIREYRALAPTP